MKEIYIDHMGNEHHIPENQTPIIVEWKPGNHHVFECEPCPKGDGKTECWDYPTTHIWDGNDFYYCSQCRDLLQVG